jgi:hypothetical protein
MHYMFEDAPEAVLDGSKTLYWNVESVTNFYHMFHNAFKANPDLRNWNTTSAETMRGMFMNAISATTPTGDFWNTWKVTTFEDMFYGLPSQTRSRSTSGTRTS